MSDSYDAIFTCEHHVLQTLGRKLFYSACKPPYSVLRCVYKVSCEIRFKVGIVIDEKLSRHNCESRFTVFHYC